ncbi:single-stranded DNA-binding protein [Micromonospora sp. CPCC 206061]|uniref:single-stranded DNA-binding protein n=1 Tax=Micromonospora sp. CPCC 206061 TaxID=3122410 RepID=UPI002FEF973A
MSSIRIDVEGNIATAPELRITPTGKSVCSFRLLSTARIPDGNGGWRDGDTTAFEVTIWGKPAENAATRLRKGHRVQVTASRITAEAWTDRDEAMRTTMKLTADRVALVMNLDQQTERTGADRATDREPVAA